MTSRVLCHEALNQFQIACAVAESATKEERLKAKWKVDQVYKLPRSWKVENGFLVKAGKEKGKLVVLISLGTSH